MPDYSLDLEDDNCLDWSALDFGQKHTGLPFVLIIFDDEPLFDYQPRMAVDLGATKYRGLSSVEIFDFKTFEVIDGEIPEDIMTKISEFVRLNSDIIDDYFYGKRGIGILSDIRRIDENHS